MTQSELFAVMVGGLASVRVRFGRVRHDRGARGLPHCGVLHVALADCCSPKCSCLKPKSPRPTLPDQSDDEAPVNVIDAAARGFVGPAIGLECRAMLLAFVALIALLNGVLGGIGAWVGRLTSPWS